jgi:hypothetical protein
VNGEQRLGKTRQPYTAPAVTRVKLEDRRVVAMAVCKESLDNQACAQDGVIQLFTLNAS